MGKVNLSLTFELITLRGDSIWRRHLGSSTEPAAVIVELDFTDWIADLTEASETKTDVLLLLDSSFDLLETSMDDTSKGLI